jgi:hypothetical protein
MACKCWLSWGAAGSLWWGWRCSSQRRISGNARSPGAADCVEIVVVAAGMARDFWREMPSGNAPSGRDPAQLTVWCSTHFRFVRAPAADFVAPGWSTSVGESIAPAASDLVN